jgi:imidazolonepropionase-like amidohydrolase
LPLLLSSPVNAFDQTEPLVGIRENTPGVHAIVNARIVVRPGEIIDRGTLVIRDGVIQAVGPGVEPPPDARIWDGEGLTLYPGLLDAHTHVGMGKRPSGRGGGEGPDRGAGRDAGGNAGREAGASHWNPLVHPERSAAQLFRYDEEEIDELRALGFTAALAIPSGGVFRGSSALVSLREGEANDLIIRDQVTQHVAFERTGWPNPTYPSSLMGSIALFRQTLLDAEWYIKIHRARERNGSEGRVPETNQALEALTSAVTKRMPVEIEVDDELTFLRTVRLGREFELDLRIRGSGHEYRRLAQIAETDVPVILPVDFPEPPEVEDPEEALSVSLRDLSHWEDAPGNPAALSEAGVRFVLTTDGLEKTKTFTERVRMAIDRGLDPDEALAALTVRPAVLLGVDGELGSLEKGKLAHVVVTDGDLFDEETEVVEVWVDGHRHEVADHPPVDPRGDWRLSLVLPDPEGGTRTLAWNLEIGGRRDRPNATFEVDDTKVRARKFEQERRRLVMVVPGGKLGFEGVLRLTGYAEEETMSGGGQLPDGAEFEWSATPIEKTEEEAAAGEAETRESAEEAGAEEEQAAEEAPPVPVLPAGAYGRPALPEQPPHLLVRDATLWTCGPQGRLEETDLLVERGKIREIGPDLEVPPGALVIEAAGKHVTPGLIDAHSHTGIYGGVNEGTQAVTSEVRIADVVDSDDIAFYRELAGGLTVANQLHGSANPIGGQNSVVKLRWGDPPADFGVPDALPGIKFALGENVKQSNWGNDYTTRYPQTRMGVEQIIRDRFRATLDYERRWKESQSSRRSGGLPPRRDLELEALAEILHGLRKIHCHSYRQDEILMLVRVAEDFGFEIGVFQHVLEGYKVAEVLAEHGAGASCFSDWWAYKFEVYDAIPYNGGLMHDVGVLTSFNSDSDELARRLNTEAAKAVKYGGLSEEEALKLVTINPARQLGIDHRAGSLEKGKDADFVIWSGHPLSTYTICEQTWIDGRRYFDRDEDLEMRERVASERARIIQKILSRGEKKKPNGKDGPDSGEESPSGEEVTGS